MEAIITHFRDDFRVLEVDTKQVTYKGFKWREMGSWGKQKYENSLFLEHVQKEPKRLVKIIYKT